MRKERGPITDPIEQLTELTQMRRGEMGGRLTSFFADVHLLEVKTFQNIKEHIRALRAIITFFA